MSRRALAEALVTAASAGDTKLVKALLADGASPDDGHPPWRPLASGANFPAVVAVLLAAGANPNLRAGLERGTALHAAWCAPRSIALLVDAGAEVDARDSLGRTPLHNVAQSGSTKEVAALLRRGASVDVRDKAGQTPLWVACHRGSVPIAKALVAAGADPGITDKRGKSPLHAARTSGADVDLALFRRLLQRPAR